MGRKVITHNSKSYLPLIEYVKNNLNNAQKLIGSTSDFNVEIFGILFIKFNQNITYLCPFVLNSSKQD